MIVVTADSITGKKVVRTLGLVRGNTVRPAISARTFWRACAGS